MKVKLVMHPANRIIKDKGLDPSGDVQRFHTQNVLRRIQRYMPYRTGATIKIMIAPTNVSRPEICKRTGEEEGGTINLQYLPHELVGQYFEEVV